jgi:hypothetical protein
MFILEDNSTSYSDVLSLHVSCVLIVADLAVFVCASSQTHDIDTRAFKGIRWICTHKGFCAVVPASQFLSLVLCTRYGVWYVIWMHTVFPSVTQFFELFELLASSMQCRLSNKKLLLRRKKETETKWFITGSCSLNYCEIDICVIKSTGNRKNSLWTRSSGKN